MRVQRPGRRPRATALRAALVGAVAGVATVAGAVVGDPLAGQASTSAGTPPAGGTARIPLLLWTTASDADRLIVGQWTWHFSDNREGIQNDRIVAGVFRGYFAGSFRTTHGNRAWAVGVERHWLVVGSGAARGALGYRLGLVYGYDGRLGWLPEAVPVLPFAQPMVYGEVGPFAAEVTHTWVVVSLSVSVTP